MSSVKGVVAIAAVCGLVGLAGAAGSISADQFAAQHALVKPAPDEETWEQIPWLTSLGQARSRAAAQGKPILLWEMDGHPLGST